MKSSKEKSSQESYLIAQVVYYGFHVFTLTLFSLRPCSLRQSLLSGERVYPLSFLALVLLEMGLYLMARGLIRKRPWDRRQDFSPTSIRWLARRAEGAGRDPCEWKRKLLLQRPRAFEETLRTLWNRTALPHQTLLEVRRLHRSLRSPLLLPRNLCRRTEHGCLLDDAGCPDHHLCLHGLHREIIRPSREFKYQLKVSSDGSKDHLTEELTAPSSLPPSPAVWPRSTFLSSRQARPTEFWSTRLPGRRPRETESLTSGPTLDASCPSTKACAPTSKPFFALEVEFPSSFRFHSTTRP